MSTLFEGKTVTVPEIRKRKGAGPRLSMLTAYDYPSARLLDEAGVDILLVGDSVGTVMWGLPHTLSVSLDEMIPYAKSVARGAARALVVGDLPMGSYQVTPEQALESALRFVKECGAHAVKLEGGSEMADTVRKLVRSGIPVMGHIGLTPQSLNVMGSYRMHGKEPAERDELLRSAKALEEAGAFSLVLECVEEGLSREITGSISIPTIGIGSGNVCDGEVLVLHDLLGLTLGKVPKFVRPEANLKELVSGAAARFIARTRERK